MLCDQQDETTDHMLASCIFTHEVWHRLLSRVGLQHLAPTDLSLSSGLVAEHAIDHPEALQAQLRFAGAARLLDDLEGAQSENLRQNDEDVVSADRSHSGGG